MTALAFLKLEPDAAIPLQSTQPNTMNVARSAQQQPIRLMRLLLIAAAATDRGNSSNTFESESYYFTHALRSLKILTKKFDY